MQLVPWRLGWEIKAEAKQRKECCRYNKEGDDNDVSVDNSADGGSDGFGMAEIILGESLVRPCLGYVREIQRFQPWITVKH